MPQLLFFALVMSFLGPNFAFSGGTDPKSPDPQKSAKPEPISPATVATFDTSKEVHVIFPDKLVVQGPDPVDLGDVDTSKLVRKKTPKLITISAAVGAHFSTLPLYPLELIRQRRMLNSNEKGNFFKGLKPFATASLTSTVIGMSSYRILRENGFGPLGAGAIGTVLTNFLTNPLYMYQIKYSLASERNPYSWLQFKNEFVTKPDAKFLEKANHVGKVALRGQMAAMGTVPSQAGFYYLYHEMNQFLKESMGGQPGGSMEFCRHAVAAALARSAVTPTQYPFEQIRAIRQKEDLNYDQILSKLVREGGVKSFYKGVTPALIRSSLGTSIYIATFNHLLKIFRAIGEKS